MRVDGKVDGEVVEFKGGDHARGEMQGAEVDGPGSAGGFFFPGGADMIQEGFPVVECF